MSHNREFLPPDNDEIIEILKVVSESNFEELQLEMGRLKLFISKHAIEPSDNFLEPSSITENRLTKTRQIVPEYAAESLDMETDEPVKITTQETHLENRDITVKEGLIPIKSPLLGIFYRSPKPGAPPFVKDGSHVAEADTVCLIEVMKLFTTVKAGLNGRIVKICAENNEMVEYGQILFLVEPE